MPVKPVSSRAIAAIILVILIFIYGATLLKKEYDFTLFFTAAFAGITANIISLSFVNDLIYEKKKPVTPSIQSTSTSSAPAK